MRTRAVSKPVAIAAQAAQEELLPKMFAILLGSFLGICLLKFGNPVVLERYVAPPANMYEWIFDSWKGKLAWWLLAGVSAAGVPAARRRTDLPRWLVWLPLAWLFWQIMAATRTVDDRLTMATLGHFAGCVACFYLGLFALGRRRSLGLFSIGLLAGFVLMLASGFEQHFGGLEATKRIFFLYHPSEEVPPEFLKRMTGGRIFATLLYPNTLAGVILMVLPMALAAIWSAQKQFTAGARSFLMGATSLGALACLYWSGSKGGWLLMLVLVLVGSFFLRFNRRLKVILLTAVLVLGLVGFGLKYAGFFKRGATSVAARFDYWHTAMLVIAKNPVLGSGPGTFGTPYVQDRKRPGSEPARMTHNDYLEQASDSGVPGFLLYTGFVASVLIYTYMQGWLREDWIRLGVWLGLLGWAMQSLMEFGLYIPAVGWLAFCMMGWLLAQCGSAAMRPTKAVARQGQELGARNEIDTPKEDR
jgi:O-antigen ligase